jgi:hypothetical protein
MSLNFLKKKLVKTSNFGFDEDELTLPKSEFVKLSQAIF